MPISPEIVLPPASAGSLPAAPSRVLTAAAEAVAPAAALAVLPASGVGSTPVPPAGVLPGRAVVGPTTDSFVLTGSLIPADADGLWTEIPGAILLAGFYGKRGWQRGTYVIQHNTFRWIMYGPGQSYHLSSPMDTPWEAVWNPQLLGGGQITLVRSALLPAPLEVLPGAGDLPAPLAPLSVLARASPLISGLLRNSHDMPLLDTNNTPLKIS